MSNQRVNTFSLDNIPEHVQASHIQKLTVWHDRDGMRGDDWKITLDLQGHGQNSPWYIDLSLDSGPATTPEDDSIAAEYRSTHVYPRTDSESLREYLSAMVTCTQEKSLTLSELDDGLKHNLRHLCLANLKNDIGMEEHHPPILFLNAVVEMFQEAGYIPDVASDFVAKLEEHGWDVVKYLERS